MFYNEDAINELNDEDQDLLLDDENDMLMDQDLEDDQAAVIGKQSTPQYIKKSPNLAANTRKGNLTNISNTV